MRHTSAELRLRVLGTAATALALLTLAACGGSGDKADPPTTSPRSSTTTKAVVTTTTQPPSTDAKAVVPVMESLLHQWDASLTELLQDPGAALRDPHGRPRTDLEAPFTDDSPYVADIDKLLSGYADRGQANRLGPSGKGQQSVYLRPTNARDPDSLTFLWCSFDDSVTYNVKTKAVVDANVGITQGEGVAVRKAGQWRIYRLRQLGFVSKPPGTANPCPTFAEGSRPRT